MIKSDSLPGESKDNLAASNKKAESLRIDDLEYQYGVPSWENKFVEIIEQMRTIPYVSLGHFQFITVNFITENVEENLPIVDKIVLEEEPFTHWDLVKRMIFSKSNKNMKSPDKPLKEQSIKDKSFGSKANRLNSQTNLLSKNYGGKIKNQFDQFVNYFKNILPVEQSSQKRVQINQEEKKDQSGRSNKKKVKKTESKRMKSLSLLNTLKIVKKSMRQKIRSDKFFKKFRRQKKSELNLKVSNKKKNRSPDSECSSIKSKSSKILDSASKRDSKISKRPLDKRKEVLFDLNELTSRKKFHKLSSIMSKDAGPYTEDYRFLLGIDFWSNYCGVEKHQLISVCPSSFWLKEMCSFRSKTTLKENQQSESKKEYSIFSEFKQFLKGTDKPAKAPQRVISPEEKFRLIPYPKLFNPNTDLKKTFHTNTMQDQLNKKLRKLYISIVYLIGGKYPLKRHVGFEEAYEDLLLWVLDTYQAKTRFIALLNDQIKFEIN